MRRRSFNGRGVANEPNGRQQSAALSSQLWGRPMQEALIVRREQHVPAPPAAVFALLTDPEKILRFFE
jgi:hypothetical protein